MANRDKFVVVIKNSVVELQPATSETVLGVACIFGNSTNQTVYLWHWPDQQGSSEVPSLLLPISSGCILTLYYPTSFYFRATHGFDRCEKPFKESTVGDKYRRMSLVRIAA
jgi:hypothetical protein